MESILVVPRAPNSSTGPYCQLLLLPNLAIFVHCENLVVLLGHNFYGPARSESGRLHVRQLVLLPHSVRPAARPHLARHLPVVHHPYIQLAQFLVDLIVLLGHCVPNERVIIIDNCKAIWNLICLFFLNNFRLTNSNIKRI